MPANAYRWPEFLFIRPEGENALDASPEPHGSADIARSEAIARRSRSRLMAVASGLDRRRYRLFCPAYASMRIIDDLVDEALPDPASGMTGEAAQAALQVWLSSCEAALQGRFAPDSGGHPVLAELAGVADGLGMPARPWRLLAEALAQDIAGSAPQDWAGFYRYSAGASGGPTEAFLNILALRMSDIRISQQASDIAAESAISLSHYCYLIHIARDLVADASGDPRLLSVPTQVLAGLGLGKDDLRQAASQARTEPFLPVLQAVLAEATCHLDAVERAEAAMRPVLDELGQAGLARIVQAYRDLAVEIGASPQAWLERGMKAVAG